MAQARSLRYGPRTLLIKGHANGPNIVGPNNVVTCCACLHGTTTMLAFVAYSLKPVKLLGPCERTQHCWPTTPNNVGSCWHLLRPFAWASRGKNRAFNHLLLISDDFKYRYLRFTNHRSHSLTSVKRKAILLFDPSVFSIPKASCKASRGMTLLITIFYRKRNAFSFRMAIIFQNIVLPVQNLGGGGGIALPA